MPLRTFKTTIQLCPSSYCLNAIWFKKYYEYSVVDYYASRLLTRDAGPISYINEPDELFKLPFASGPMWLIMIDWYNDDLMKNNSIWASLNITDQSRYESVLLMRVQGTK